jgi:hypothetical protein
MKLLILVALFLITKISFAKTYVFDFLVTSRETPELVFKINKTVCPLKVRKHESGAASIRKDWIITCFVNLESGSYFFDLDMEAKSFNTKVKQWYLGVLSMPADCPKERRPYCLDEKGNSQYVSHQLSHVFWEDVNESFGNGEFYRRSDSFRVR